MSEETRATDVDYLIDALREATYVNSIEPSKTLTIIACDLKQFKRIDKEMYNRYYVRPFAWTDLYITETLRKIRVLYWGQRIKIIVDVTVDETILALLFKQTIPES